MADIKIATLQLSVRCGTCEEGELLEVLQEGVSQFTGRDAEGVGAIGTFTDEVCGFKYEELRDCLVQAGRMARLLELRAFVPAGELHVVRDAMGARFSWRLAYEGTEGVPTDCFDEIQYLDIDSSPRGYQPDDAFSYQSMNGGSYRLHIEGAERIQIRNYLTYDNEGMAHVADFRIVKMVRGCKA